MLISRCSAVLVAARHDAAVEPDVARGRGEEPSAPDPHLPGDSRQAGNRADCLAAVQVPVDRLRDLDHRRLGRRVLDRQAADRLGIDAGDLGGPVERILRRPLPQLAPADRVLLQPLLGVQPFLEDDVDHRQRQGRVGPRQRLDVPIGRARGLGPARIDHDDLRAVPLRLAHQRHEMRAGRGRVVRPDQHHLALQDMARIGSEIPADRRVRRRSGSRPSKDRPPI